MKTDKRLVDLEQHVKDLKNGITDEKIYQLLLDGYKCYKQGLGIPQETVFNTITKALK